MTKKSATFNWSEEPSEQQGMVTMIIATAGEDYRTDVPEGMDEFAKVSTVVSVQASLGKPN